MKFLILINSDEALHHLFYLFIRILYYSVDLTWISSRFWTPVLLFASERFTTDFGAEPRVKSPEAILFHKHSEAVVVSDVSVCTGKGTFPASLKTAADLYLLGQSYFSVRNYREKCICFG